MTHEHEARELLVDAGFTQFDAGAVTDPDGTETDTLRDMADVLTDESHQREAQGDQAAADAMWDMASALEHAADARPPKSRYPW